MHSPDNRRHIETTTDRQLASAIWQEARRRRVKARGEIVNGVCRVELNCFPIVAWRIVTAANFKVKQERAAAAIAQAQAIEAKDDAGYSDDTWAQDEALTDDGHYFDCSSMEYARAIFDEARARGFDAQWRRAEADSRKPWRVAVWEVSQAQFSELLQVASRSTLVAA